MQLLEGSQRLGGEGTKVTNQSESDGILADKQGQVFDAGQRGNDALPISRESIESTSVTQLWLVSSTVR